METYLSREEFEASFPNVKGTALGPSNELIVLVTKKVDESDLNPTDIVPKQVLINGIKYTTDVQTVGIPHLISAAEPEAETTPQDHRARHRPIPGGVSIGNAGVGAGTMGSPLLEHEGDPVVLTNAHVGGKARHQYQPAAMDGGTGDEPFGFLREASVLDPDQPQTTDSALIDVNPDEIDSRVLGVGELVDFGEPDFTREYVKAGRTTGVTHGDLRGRDASLRVAYGSETVRFVGCDVFSDLSDAGDSGSLIGYKRDEDEFVATDLLFAGSDQATIAIPIPRVEEFHGPLSIPSSGDNDDSAPEPESMTLTLGRGKLYGTAEYSFAVSDDAEIEFTGQSSTLVDNRINGWVGSWTNDYTITGGHITDVSIPEGMAVWVDDERISNLEDLVEGNG